VPACRHRVLHLHQDVTSAEHPDDRDALGKQQRGRLLRRGIWLVRSSNERAIRRRTGPAGSSITARTPLRIRSCAIWVPCASPAG
jgi:hypothetical protein